MQGDDDGGDEHRGEAAEIGEGGEGDEDMEVHLDHAAAQMNQQRAEGNHGGADRRRRQPGGRTQEDEGARTGGDQEARAHGQIDAGVKAQGDGDRQADMGDQDQRGPSVGPGLIVDFEGVHGIPNT